MKSIVLEFQYRIMKSEGRTYESGDRLIFSKLTHSGCLVELDLRYPEGSLVVSTDWIPVNGPIVEELRQLRALELGKASPACREFVDRIRGEVDRSAVSLLETIKYLAGHVGISESPLATTRSRWTDDKINFLPLPTIVTASWEITSAWPLDERTKQKLQETLDAGFEPLIAMRHLHRARADQSPRHRYIHGALAAELAIKEVIARKHPNIVPLLNEVPSPPIAKLYGSIMEYYLGKKSPFRSELIKGQEIRNSLVHRPSSASPTTDEATAFVDAVDGAIFHLLSLLYPSNWFIANEVLRRSPEPD